jgi:DNA-binding MarR family transcriptional regulator
VNTTEALLKGMLATVGRAAFAPEAIMKIVAPTTRSEKQIIAYNLCDGATSQTEIAKKSGVDKSDLSKLVGKWVEAGVVIRIGAEQFPLHLYAVSGKPVKGAA